MSCTTCLQAKPIALCASLLTIGRIKDADGNAVTTTNVKIRFENAFGKIVYVLGATDGSGDLQVDLSLYDFGKMFHKIAVLSEDGITQYTIEVDEEDGDCIEFEFITGDFEEQVIQLKD